MSESEDIALSAQAVRRPSRTLRILQVVMIWGLILGLLVGLAWIIAGVWRDSMPLIERRLAQMRSTTTVAAARPLPGESDPPATRVVDGHTITSPAWVTVPSPVYPYSPGTGMRSGRVSLACDVAPTGRLGACTIVEEVPQGQGFGSAALEATRTARMAPRTVDGVPTGGTVRFTMRFEPAP